MHAHMHARTQISPYLQHGKDSLTAHQRWPPFSGSDFAKLLPPQGAQLLHWLDAAASRSLNSLVALGSERDPATQTLILTHLTKVSDDDDDDDDDDDEVMINVLRCRLTY